MARHPLVEALAAAISAWNSGAWDGKPLDSCPYSVTATALPTTVEFRAVIGHQLNGRQQIEAVAEVSRARLSLTFNGCCVIAQSGSTAFYYSLPVLRTSLYESTDASGEPTLCETLALARQVAGGWR